MKKCNKCSAEWEDSFTFCPKCGSSLEAENLPQDDAYATALAKVNDLPLDKREKQGWHAVAKAFPIIAQVIKENFPAESFRYVVAPSELDARADKEALPIHFLFYKNGQPKVAVVISTTYGFKATNVVKTQNFCISRGIKYLRMYADGFWADWITGQDIDGKPVTAETVRMCKERLVARIQESLGNKVATPVKPVEPVKEDSTPDLYKDLEKALEENLALQKKYPEKRVQTLIYRDKKHGGYNIIGQDGRSFFIVLHLGYGNNYKNELLTKFIRSKHYGAFRDINQGNTHVKDVIYHLSTGCSQINGTARTLGDTLLSIGYDLHEKVNYKTSVDNGNTPIQNLNSIISGGSMSSGSSLNDKPIIGQKKRLSDLQIIGIVILCSIIAFPLLFLIIYLLV